MMLEMMLSYALNLENENRRLREELDSLGEYTERLRMELSQHGWGDFHYQTIHRQDPAIVALLAERGTNGSRITSPPVGGNRESEQRQDPVGWGGSREDSYGLSILYDEGGTG